MTRSATYSPATVKRARTIIANCERQQNARTQRSVKPARAAAKPAPKPAAWRNRAASATQMARINDAYVALNLRTFATLGDFREVFPTAGAASDEFQRPVVKAAYYATR